MVDSQRGTKRRVGYNLLVSNKSERNNFFIENNQEILLDFADFALQDRTTRRQFNGRCFSAMV